MIRRAWRGTPSRPCSLVLTFEQEAGRATLRASDAPGLPEALPYVVALLCSRRLRICYRYIFLLINSDVFVPFSRYATKGTTFPIHLHACTHGYARALLFFPRGLMDLDRHDFMDILHRKKVSAYSL